MDKIEHSKNLIKEAIEEYHRIAVAVSWGKDSMALLHMARQIKPDIRVFTIVTPFKPKETLEFKDRIKKEWNLSIKEYQSKEGPMPGLWETAPDECCRIFKVDPTKEAVKDLDAWIAGLRKTEGRTRVDYKEIEK